MKRKNKSMRPANVRLVGRSVTVGGKRLGRLREFIRSLAEAGSRDAKSIEDTAARLLGPRQ